MLAEGVYIHFPLLPDVQKHRGHGTFPGGLRVLCPMLTEAKLVIRALHRPRANPFDKFSQDTIHSNQNTTHPECWHENGTLSPFPVPLPWTVSQNVGHLESIIDCSLSPTHHIPGTVRVCRLHSWLSHLPPLSLLLPLTIPLGSYIQHLPQGLISSNWLPSIFLRKKSNNVILLFLNMAFFPTKRAQTSKLRLKSLQTLILDRFQIGFLLLSRVNEILKLNLCAIATLQPVSFSMYKSDHSTPVSNSVCFTTLENQLFH